MFFSMVTRILKLAIGGIFLIPLVACSSSDFVYVNRDDLTHDALYIAEKPDMIRPTNYGALKLRSEEQEHDKGNLFILQRNKGVYQAETMFLENKDKKFYFSFGMNYREQAPKVGLRVEF